MEQILNVTLPIDERLQNRMLVFTTKTKTIFMFDQEIDKLVDLPLSLIIRTLIDEDNKKLLLKLMLGMRGESTLAAAKGSDYNTIDDDGVVIVKQREQDKFTFSAIKVEQKTIEEVLKSL